MKLNDRLTLNQALLWIAIGTLCISGFTTGLWLYSRHFYKQRLHNSDYNIVSIVQTGPEKEQLKTAYLAELLELSIDRPTNLFGFDVAVAEKKLLAHPLIKQVKIKKIQPGTIFIDYTIRQPTAFLGDYSNTAIDSEGILIPFSPFFTPKKLPIIYLGLNEHINEEIYKIKWGDNLNDLSQHNHYSKMAFTILKTLKENCESDIAKIRKIDVSKAFEDSYGHRQIIAVMEDSLEKEINKHSALCFFPRILRLSVERYRSELKNYLKLREHLLNQEALSAIDSSLLEQDKGIVIRSAPMIIDLRIPQLAFFAEKY